MSAARKYTRAGTRRGAGGAAFVAEFRAGAAVGAGGAAFVADFGAGAAVGAGGAAVGADFGAGGMAVGAGRVRRTYGARPVGDGGTAEGRGAAVVGGFGAPFGTVRSAKHLFLRASQAGSTARLMHSPRA